MFMAEGQSAQTVLGAKPRHILAVDDDRTALMMLDQSLADLGYQVTSVGGGAAALAALSQPDHTIDVVVLDRRMPEVDGIEVVRRMKADPVLQNIPIIMLTGASDEDEIEEGISAGVFYYLAKPASTALMRTVVSAAMREAAQRKALAGRATTQFAALKNIDTCRIYLRTLEEADEVAALLSTCFPDPARVAEGLLELLKNAVEHGVYQLGYEAKSKILGYGTVEDHLRRLYADPAYEGRRAEVVFTRKHGGYSVVITDPGPGFDWRTYLTVNPARATDSHGRGIAKAAQVAFDRVSYSESGNRVVGFVSGDDPLDW
jgi:two-component system, cell cycle response regulator